MKTSIGRTLLLGTFIALSSAATAQTNAGYTSRVYDMPAQDSAQTLPGSLRTCSCSGPLPEGMLRISGPTTGTPYNPSHTSRWTSNLVDEPTYDTICITPGDYTDWGLMLFTKAAANGNTKVIKPCSSPTLHPAVATTPGSGVPPVAPPPAPTGQVIISALQLLGSASNFHFENLTVLPRKLVNFKDDGEGQNVALAVDPRSNDLLGLSMISTYGGLAVGDDPDVPDVTMTRMLFDGYNARVEYRRESETRVDLNIGSASLAAVGERCDIREPDCHVAVGRLLCNVSVKNCAAHYPDLEHICDDTVENCALNYPSATVYSGAAEEPHSCPYDYTPAPGLPNPNEAECFKIQDYGSLLGLAFEVDNSIIQDSVFRDTWFAEGDHHDRMGIVLRAFHSDYYGTQSPRNVRIRSNEFWNLTDGLHMVGPIISDTFHQAPFTTSANDHKYGHPRTNWERIHFGGIFVTDNDFQQTRYTDCEPGNIGSPETLYTHGGGNCMCAENGLDIKVAGYPGTAWEGEPQNENHPDRNFVSPSMVIRGNRISGYHAVSGQEDCVGVDPMVTCDDGSSRRRPSFGASTGMVSHFSAQGQLITDNLFFNNYAGIGLVPPQDMDCLPHEAGTRCTITLHNNVFDEIGYSGSLPVYPVDAMLGCGQEYDRGIADYVVKGSVIISGGKSISISHNSVIGPKGAWMEFHELLDAPSGHDRFGQTIARANFVSEVAGTSIMLGEPNLDHVAGDPDHTFYDGFHDWCGNYYEEDLSLSPVFWPVPASSDPWCNDQTVSPDSSVVAFDITPITDPHPHIVESAQTTAIADWNSRPIEDICFGPGSTFATTERVEDCDTSCSSIPGAIMGWGGSTCVSPDADIHPTAFIAGAIIHAGAIIGAYADVSGSCIGPYADVGYDTKVWDSNIACGVRIGKKSRYERANIGAVAWTGEQVLLNGKDTSIGYSSRIHDGVNTDSGDTVTLGAGTRIAHYMLLPNGLTTEAGVVLGTEDPVNGEFSMVYFDKHGQTFGRHSTVVGTESGTKLVSEMYVGAMSFIDEKVYMDSGSSTGEFSTLAMGTHLEDGATTKPRCLNTIPTTLGYGDLLTHDPTVTTNELCNTVVP